MEVHHHPNVEKKSFKEYLLEGLMIFLAVTLGFIAESYHNHLDNNEIEKRNIESFIVNVQRDSANLFRDINRCQNKMNLIDSLISVPGKFTDTLFEKRFFTYLSKLLNYERFTPDESAFMQMQSSGTLRLIKKQNITDSILKYQATNLAIKRQQEIVNRYFNSATDNTIQITDLRQVPFKLNGNNQQIQNYINYKIAEGISSRFYLEHLKNQLRNATILIPF